MEAKRIEALKTYDLLDTEQEKIFDNITKMAAVACKMPISLISFVDKDREWIKSSHGIDTKLMPQEISFSRQNLRENNIFVIENTLTDPQFSNHPLVTGPLNIQFYAAIRLVNSQGFYLGTLCVIDHIPRKLTEEHKEILDILVRQIITISEDRRKNRQLIEYAPNAMLMINKKRQIRLINKEVEKLFGYHRSELIGQQLEILLPARFKSKHPKYVDQYFEAPSIRSMGAGRDLFGLKKDGSEVAIEIGLNPLVLEEGTFILASIIDITERKKAEERFRLIVESVPNSMLMIDKNRTITLINKQLEKLFGYKRDELIGQQLEILLPDRFKTKHPEFVANYFKSLSIRSMGAGRDLYGLKKDGTEVAIEIGLNPLVLQEGTFILASIIDITERKKMEQMKVEFISTVSHELRTPLTSVRGSLGLLLSEKFGDISKDVKDLLNIALTNCERLIRLINDILDIEKMESGQDDFKLVPTKLTNLVQDVLSANKGYSEQYEVRLQFESDFSEMIYIDPDKITQVITNLLSNAIKFSPAGESILVKINGLDKKVRVSIIDNGSGIPENFKNKIFEKFSQADSSDRREKGGTGLGLNICKTIVEKHSGIISFDPEKTKGAHFYFDLPFEP